MSTSDLEGVVDFDPREYATDDPMGAARYRDELLGSANHKADELAQVRFAWVAADSALLVGNETPHATIEAAGSLDVATGTQDDGARWYLFGEGVTYAPKIKADGSAYDLRIELAGASSGGHRVDFGVVVAPRMAPQLQAVWGSTPAGAIKYFTNVTSTTPAWLTADDASRMLTIPKSIVEDALSLEPAWSTLTDIGGTRTSVQLPLLQIKPFGQTWNAGSEPQLFGLVVAEYIGI